MGDKGFKNYWICQDSENRNSESGLFEALRNFCWQQRGKDKISDIGILFRDPEFQPVKQALVWRGRRKTAEDPEKREIEASGGSRQKRTE